MKPAPPTPPPAASRPLPLPGGPLLVVNWIIPGLGFWLCQRRTRGALQFLMVIVTFALGLVLRGGVDWPSWSLSAPDFNLINNFTFIIQLGAGAPALASLLANLLHLSPALDWLAGMPTHPYYDLGGYFMIVAGAINYFTTCNLFDRLIRPTPAYAAQETPELKDTTEQS